MDLFEDLQWRGLAYQWTGDEALPARLREGPVTLYYGCDPSAPSLHVGNLVGLVTLRRFQLAGHRPIALAGGATGMIGDPSGRSEERNLLSEETLRANVERIKVQLTRFIDFDAGGMLVNNFDWFRDVGFLEFLRNVGKDFSLNVLLSRESVAARLRSSAGISFTEFSYQLLQAYDFLHLRKQHECELQIGGSDQFGNIVAGVDLIRKQIGAVAYGLTWPLLTRSDGAKMGKTAEGAVWLDPSLTSPYAFYQYFLRVPDLDAGPFLRTFTFVSRPEIEALETATAEAPHRREAQKRLARELTLLVHGEVGLAAAQRATDALFGGDLAGLTEGQLLEIFADVPSVDLPASRLGSLNAVDALVEAGLAASKSDARRLVEGGGAHVGNRRIETPDEALSGKDLASETVMVLRAGKKSFALLRFTA